LSADVHAKAKARFAATFAGAGDAVLALETTEVIATAGSLGAAVGRVGLLLTDLPPEVSSADLDAAVSTVLTSSASGATARLVLSNGATLSVRLFTLLSEDAARRYLVAILTPDVGPEELGRLRLNDRVYELWFERAPSGVCLVATDGTFLRANPAYCQLVGRSESELQGLTFQDITHPDDLLLDVSLVEDVLADRIDRYDTDKRYIRPDGSIVWVHLTVALLHDKDGSPLHFISMLEDITARRQAQEQLQAALELWRTTFELSPVAMVELALDGTIVRANAAAGELMGCDADELLGQRTPDLGDPSAADDSYRNLARLASGELKTNVAERRLRDRRGRDLWLSVHTAGVAGPDGSVERLLMQVIDITESHELRERLQRSVDELSNAYREKAALMTALSHDLRTPIATIRILAELLVTSQPEMSQGERADIASRLLAEAARTEGVLGDLVASERASSGLITPKRVPIVLNDVVQRVVRFEADQVTSHRVEIRLSETDSTVSADPALVERIIGNLVVNAFRHTRPDSTVWITVDGSAGDREPVRLIVEDNGAGVPDEMKKAIFEPFVRAVPEDRPGSGLGLFLVRRFAEFHGGNVECFDRPGGGASFQVTLPRH
jgi:PAS domain S-box-containing protein